MVSSYIPSISALIAARRNFRPIALKSLKVILAASPQPYNNMWNALPNTAEEIRECAEVLADLNPSILLQGGSGTSNATVAHIIDAIPQANILHLASHGHQDRESPLESGFILEDDILTISRLMPLSLPNAFLAFLSACETAKGDAKQPDQTVHLAAAMLFVGFKSIIGTMW